ncbi:MAG: PbpA [Desulfobacteraceae bacterium]|nr:PbpA [Desulfobacteraceae bacterium]
MKALFRNTNRRDRITGARPGWRAYQKSLQRQNTGSRWWRRKRYIPFYLAAVLVILFVFGKSDPTPPVDTGTATIPGTEIKAAAITDSEFISKKDVRVLMGDSPLMNLDDPVVRIDFQEQALLVTTSVDIRLQNHLIKKLDQKNSRYIGIVGMVPSTGRILCMVGFDKGNPAGNPCLDNSFPAASIFKIVTAAAAVETRDLRELTTMNFNGYKHTLYKNQLKTSTNKYTNKISFRDAFAQSVNPVFGKIGSLHLGKSNLEKYSNAFGFNTDLNFELDLPPSRISINDDKYEWAEIASGFNRQTTISAVHGVMVASGIVNDGKMMEPTIIDNIVSPDDQIIYRSQPQTFNTAMNTATSKILYNLMERTVTNGTAKKAFRRYKRDKTLSALNIGGKTGSIFNKKRDLRIDWFVGFAERKKGPGEMAVAVVVAHEEFIGRRAAEYAQIAISHYFENSAGPAEKK